MPPPPPIFNGKPVIGLSKTQRRRYQRLKRRRHDGTLTDAQREELDALHGEARDEHWTKGPWYGPRAVAIDLPTLGQRRGRLRGPSRERLDALMDAARQWAGPEPPTQAWVADRMNFGPTFDPADPQENDRSASAVGKMVSRSDGSGDHSVRKILKACGYTWKTFIEEFWRSREQIEDLTQEALWGEFVRSGRKEQAERASGRTIVGPVADSDGVPHSLDDDQPTGPPSEPLRVRFVPRRSDSSGGG